MSETEIKRYPSTLFNTPVPTDKGVEIYNIAVSGIHVCKLNNGETGITAYDKVSRIYITLTDSAVQHLVSLLNG